MSRSRLVAYWETTGLVALGMVSGGVTQVVITEQGDYLDGLDRPEPGEQGTQYQMAKLEASHKQ